MSEIPRITGKEAVRAFERAGFVCVRVSKSSHHIMKKPGCRNLLSIPVHAGKTVGKGLLKSQIDAAGMTIDEFKKHL
jgi:predicted RNA binding protein YcfA (HicA-like mRNA interferase family)